MSVVAKAEGDVQQLRELDLLQPAVESLVAVYVQLAERLDSPHLDARDRTDLTRAFLAVRAAMVDADTGPADDFDRLAAELAQPSDG